MYSTTTGIVMGKLMGVIWHYTSGCAWLRRKGDWFWGLSFRTSIGDLEIPKRPEGINMYNIGYHEPSYRFAAACLEACSRAYMQSGAIVCLDLVLTFFLFPTRLSTFDLRPLLIMPLESGQNG